MKIISDSLVGLILVISYLAGLALIALDKIEGSFALSLLVPPISWYYVVKYAVLTYL